MKVIRIRERGGGQDAARRSSHSFISGTSGGEGGGESINLNQNKHKRVREGLNDLCFNAAHRIFTVVFCEDYLCERISEAALLPFYLTHNSKRLKIKAS